MLERDAPYVQIIEHYRQEIRAGRLQDGDMLPSGREIAQQFGVSLATAAKVATGLQALGLVTPRPGGGTMVAARRAARGPGHAAGLWCRTRYVWRFEDQRYWTNFYDDPEEARADATTQITEQIEGSWHERAGARCSWRTGSTSGAGCSATSGPRPAPSTSTSSRVSSFRSSKGASSDPWNSRRSRPGRTPSPPASAHGERPT